MDLEAVRTFVAAAAAGQFAEAADDLSITQQAVSKRIAALEKDLGVRLFTRTARGAQLTTEGQAFLPHARDLLQAEERAAASVRPGRRALRVDVTDPDFGTEPLLEVIAGSPALATFVGEQTRLLWPADYRSAADRRARPGAGLSALTDLAQRQPASRPHHPAQLPRLRPAQPPRHRDLDPGLGAPTRHPPLTGNPRLSRSSGGSRRNGMKPGFQHTRACWNRGFMTCRTRTWPRPRPTRPRPDPLSALPSGRRRPAGRLT